MIGLGLLIVLFVLLCFCLDSFLLWLLVSLIVLDCCYVVLNVCFSAWVGLFVCC